MRILILSIWLVLIVSIFYITMSIVRHQQQGKSRHSGKTSNSFSNHRKLWHELLSLLRHDRETAERLLRFEQKKNPGKSEKWYLEKVIYDLKRDRR
ncbi:hypothetical protein VB711_08835 [Cronbergia sp. UHCC 0137]|uniref:hypothetical protein n=1 Tax=Cronbergia sp. UHCC 0137 TaxID=3110239 RepID=UPI002B209A69|nr:hypothetical protein [Cronbergia sp. UHCC 0137]MEA5617942.1 hypothetical protein [Cronbergia sp. UHCC 0137]